MGALERPSSDDGRTLKPVIRTSIFQPIVCPLLAGKRLAPARGG
jgi:hypothetical protein